MPDFAVPGPEFAVPGPDFAFPGPEFAVQALRTVLSEASQACCSNAIDGACGKPESQFSRSARVPQNRPAVLPYEHIEDTAVAAVHRGQQLAIGTLRGHGGVLAASQHEIRGGPRRCRGQRKLGSSVSLVMARPYPR